MRYLKGFKSTLLIIVLMMSTVPVYSQEPAVPVSPGDSYIDGLELDQLLDVSTTTDPEIASYLDQIEKDLNAADYLVDYSSLKDTDYSNLEICLRSAMSRHLPAEIAADKIELAKRKLIKATRDLFPSITFTYEYNRGYKVRKADSDPDPDVDNSQTFESNKRRVSLSQPVYKGGALWNQVKVEKSELKVAKAEYEKTMLDLKLEVARAYLNLSKAISIKAYYEELLDKSKMQLMVSKEKMDAGLISEIEHLNVESQHSQIQHDLQAAKEEIEINRIEFKKVMHLDVDADSDVKAITDEYLTQIEKQVQEEIEKNGEQQQSKEQEAKINELVTLAYRNRPEFVIQRSKVESAKWREKVANAGWMPQIELVAEYGQKAEAYYNNYDDAPWDEEHRVGITFTWNLGGNTTKYNYDKNRQGTGTEATDPLAQAGNDGYYDRKNTVSVSVLDGLDQYSKTKEASIKHKEALLELDLSEKDVVSEVKEAYYNYHRSLVKLRSVFKKLKYREKLVGLSKHRSEINEIQISEYIQAELDFVKEKETLYQAMNDYFVAKVSLNKAIGIDDYLSIKEF